MEGSLMDSNKGVIDYDFLIRQIQRNLPTLPIIVNELTNILEDADSSTQAVEEVMVSDQAICTRILRIANTGFYRGSREKVTNASEAIGTLGFDKIKDVILTTSVFKAFAGKESAGQEFSLEGMWRHSMGVAAASRSIAKYLGKSWHETAYTCGLLHDIGKVARFKLDEDNNDNQFLLDSQAALDKNVNFFQAELINQSPRHDYLGYLICRHWGLSDAVEGVVRWHHEPNPENRQRVTPGSEMAELIDLVIVANWIVNDLKFGFSAHESPDAPPDALLARLQIYHVDKIIEDVENELKLTEDFCAILDNESKSTDERLEVMHSSGGSTESAVPYPKAEPKTPSVPIEVSDAALRSDWVGMLAPISEYDDEFIVKPVALGEEREQVLLNGIRSTIGEQSSNDDILAESAQLFDLMDADEGGGTPKLSDRQMDELMEEVRKRFGG